MLPSIFREIQRLSNMLIPKTMFITTSRNKKLDVCKPLLIINFLVSNCPGAVNIVIYRLPKVQNPI